MASAQIQPVQSGYPYPPRRRPALSRMTAARWPQPRPSQYRAATLTRRQRRPVPNNTTTLTRLQPKSRNRAAKSTHLLPQPTPNSLHRPAHLRSLTSPKNPARPLHPRPPASPKSANSSLCRSRLQRRRQRSLPTTRRRGSRSQPSWWVIPGLAQPRGGRPGRGGRLPIRSWMERSSTISPWRLRCAVTTTGTTAIPARTPLACGLSTGRLGWAKAEICCSCAWLTASATARCRILARRKPARCCRRACQDAS